MHQASGLRVRLWSLCQLIHELLGADTWSDAWISVREHFIGSVLTGHINGVGIYGCYSEFPELTDRPFSRPERIVELAVCHIERYEAMGQKKSGFLNGYLVTQRKHLESCSRCQKFAVQVIREEVREVKLIRPLFKGMTREDFPDLFE